ncbi:hypothetical protein Glove_293g9 [Diversispora epigaea]|uniref:Uncharacterized protein n=1 Tax=Diversispora epigaea TaxID=1348612 RepID=A0A397I6J9_9GLOM|nr:hypothetical protein Glove_293g9 [Diversispora epigaea]
MVTENKSELQLLIFLRTYYANFSKFLTDFFDKLINNEHITKCVTFVISLIVDMTFFNLGVWFTQIITNEKASDEKRITFSLDLFDINNQIKNVWNMFDKVINDLLNFQSCSVGTPNIIILKTEGIPNLNKGIFQSIEMYKEDFELGPYNYLNVIANETIFRKLIKQWKINIALIFKAYHIEIRVGNYKLQKNALACFVELFPSVKKSNYSISIVQYLGILVQYPKLEKKLELLETFDIKFVKKNITGNVIDVNNLNNKVGRRKLEITRWRSNDQKLKRKKAISTVTPISHSNTENSSQVISDQQILNNPNVVNQNKSPRKK